MKNQSIPSLNITWKNATVSSTAEQTMQSLMMRTTFGIIAFLSFLGNLLLCIVMVRKRSMLSKAYNVLIFNLAVADTLTGIFIVATPDYLIDRRAFPYPEGLAGEIYCRLIGSTYILFIFGKASTLTIMFLAIDRWYSIIRPIVYKTTFSKKRLYCYITLIWVISCITQVNELFITMVDNGLCTFRTPFYGIELERILILTHVTLTFYIPSIITWCSFAHIMLSMRRAAFRGSVNNIKATERLLRMCALAAFFLSVCWLPIETFFVLYKFEVYKLPFTVSLVLGVLAMFNSCLNPWIYCLSNKEYRREFMRLLCCSKFNLTGLTALFSRIPSSQTRDQYSLTNGIALSSVTLASPGTDVSMVNQRNSIFGQMTSSSDATLNRFSFQEASFDGLTNGSAVKHSL